MVTQVINTEKVVRERKAASMQAARVEINAIATRNIIQMQLEGLAINIDSYGWSVNFNK
jgi:hypothetical protein